MERGQGAVEDLVPSGGNLPHVRDLSHLSNPFRLGIPDPQLIPQAGSGDLAIWLSYKT